MKKLTEKIYIKIINPVENFMTTFPINIVYIEEQEDYLCNLWRGNENTHNCVCWKICVYICESLCFVCTQFACCMVYIVVSQHPVPLLPYPPYICTYIYITIYMNIINKLVELSSTIYTLFPLCLHTTISDIISRKYIRLKWWHSVKTIFVTRKLF